MPQASGDVSASPLSTMGESARGWLVLFACTWLLSAAMSIGLALLPGYPGDVIHYKLWTRVVATEGIHRIYAGEYPETYAIYPPITLYAYGAVGELYQRFAENPWEDQRLMESAKLSSLIKGVAVAFHLALGLAIFGIVLLLHSPRTATLTSGAYLLNPAVLFDTAYWGQPDSAHSLFVAVALGGASLGMWQVSWASAGLAAMTKPQAWALVPLYVIFQVRRSGLALFLKGVLIAGAVVLIVISPFVIHGRLGDFLSLPGAIASVMPVASANAHNLWWIVTGVPLPVVPDSDRILGSLTYRQLAMPLVLGVAGFTVWRCLTSPGTSVFLLAAYQAFGWFCFTTQAHENHPFMVVPLLVLAMPSALAARGLLLVISGTFLMNMLLHDPVTVNRLTMAISPSLQHQIQLVNSAVNLLIFGVWSAVLVWAPHWCRGELVRPSATPRPVL